MAEVLTDRSMASMVHAIEANLFSFFPLLSRWPRAPAHDEPELLWTLSHAPYPLFNRVGRARLARDRVVDAIDLAIGRCRARGVPLLGGGVAGIYNVSTRPGWRRRGIGAAVTRATVTAARDQGYRLAILHASDLGAGVYRSIGFRALCRIGQCVWVPEEQCTVDSSGFTVD